jgi:hypothetical protein
LLAVYYIDLSITCVVVRVDDPVLLAVKANRCKRTDNVRRPPRDLLLRVAKKADFAGKTFVVCKA